MKYLKLKRFCKKHIDKAKAEYYKRFFEEHKENSKKQWQVINNLLNRDTKSSKIPKLIDDSGKVINKPHDMANYFNKYFSNIASDIKSKCPDSVAKRDYYRCFLHNSVSNSIYLRPVDPSEIHELINKFKNKSTRDTKMSALKIANKFYDFTHAFSKVINKSFAEGHFPDIMKLARVIAVLKGGAKTDVVNYRPISLLSTFSKVFEKVMHFRILEFLESNKSLYDNQFGFRPGRSCEQALIKPLRHRVTYLMAYPKIKLVCYFLLTSQRLLTWLTMKFS